MYKRDLMRIGRIKQTKQFIYFGYCMILLLTSCTKQPGAFINMDVESPIINQEITFSADEFATGNEYFDWEFGEELKSGSEVTYSWNEPGTYLVCLETATKKHKKRSRVCKMVTVYHDNSHFDGVYVLQGGCFEYGIIIKPKSPGRVELINLGGYNSFPSIIANVEYNNLEIPTQQTSNEFGVFSFYGNGYITEARDTLVLDYVMDFKDYTNPVSDFTYHCQMKGGLY